MYEWIILLAVGFAQGQYPDRVAVLRTGPYPAAVLAPAPIAIATNPSYPRQTEGSKYLDTQLDAPTQPQLHHTPVESVQAAPSPSIPPDSKVSVQDGRLQYSHGFVDKSSGTSVAEQGSLLSTNDGWEYVITKKGKYSYVSPEGIPITVNYIADHNGFRILPNE